MYAEERKKRIKRVLDENKRIDVITLSQLLNVSKVTIRRDLQELQDEGFLLKTHGGAILSEDDSYLHSGDKDTYDESDKYSHDREIMGEIAKHIIEDGASVFVCPGKACEFIASSINDKKNIRFVTTDINVLMKIADGSTNSTMSVMIPGGELDVASMSMSGSITEQLLDNMYFDYALVEVDGISLKNGYSTNTASKFSIINKVISQSEQTIIVCDHFNFDNKSLFNIGDIRTFDKVISTEKTPQRYKDFYYNQNIQLFTTFDVY
jgi:DeoR family transcriptional regulator, fructose operon transcriptional repressor